MLQPGTLVRHYRVIRLIGQGGFCQTYDVEAEGKVWVLKLLTQDYAKAIALLQREAQVLSRLNHPGIPRIAPDGYFVLPDPQGNRHCLVMEKIPGIDLRQWLAQTSTPLTEPQALNWLRQLSQILAQIHQQQYFHRDIKPANIMLRPNGQLVLIDFGGVREVTETYLADQQADRTHSTRIHSRGYAPLEQIDGHAVPQSDLFALGRTFVHLLTGQPPYEFASNPQTGQLLWRQAAPHLSSGIADLLDHMMAPFPGERPASATAVFATVTQLTQPEGRRWGRRHFRRHHYLAMGLISALVTAGVVGLRGLGVLQPWELRALDTLMRLRPVEPPDPRLLVVTLDDADIQAQDAAGMPRRGSLSDQALSLLIDQLDSAALIGLDIYRDFAVENHTPNAAKLQTQLQTNPRLITVCKHPISSGSPGIAPPPESPLSHVGFSDFLPDGDGTLRRQLLFVTPTPEDACGVAYSFNAQLALRYLANQGIEPDFSDRNSLKLGSVNHPWLTATTGGYRNLDAAGGQLLVNYRSMDDLTAIADQVSLTALLAGQVPETAWRDRIVLIGVTAASAGDSWRTPYSRSLQGQLPGVYAQAHMISQLLSAVLDGRSLLRAWPTWAENLGLAGLAVLGSLIPAVYRRRFAACGVIGSILGGWGGLCWLLLLQGSWLPLLPGSIALLGAAVGMGLYCQRTTAV